MPKQGDRLSFRRRPGSTFFNVALTASFGLLMLGLCTHAAINGKVYSRSGSRDAEPLEWALWNGVGIVFGVALLVVALRFLRRRSRAVIEVTDDGVWIDKFTSRAKRDRIPWIDIAKIEHQPKASLADTPN